eukprot:jgi/Botrbrau1/2832/Bobra.0125s0039.1
MAQGMGLDPGHDGPAWQEGPQSQKIPEEVAVCSSCHKWLDTTGATDFIVVDNVLDACEVLGAQAESKKLLEARGIAAGLGGSGRIQRGDQLLGILQRQGVGADVVDAVGRLAGKWRNPESRGDRMLWLDPSGLPASSCPFLSSVFQLFERIRTCALEAGFDVGGKTTYQLACYPGGGARYVRHRDKSEQRSYQSSDCGTVPQP